eukprot:sb/3465010/
MVREHGLTDSVDDIENYNKSLFLEHFNLKNVGSTVPDADLPSEYHCTVYDCVFSTLHKGGLNTHIRYHTAQIAANSQAYRSCQKCCKIGIPLEVFGAHQCDDVMKKGNHGNENSSAVENVTSSAKAVTSPTVTEKEKVASSTTPVKISSTKLSLSLKRKSISSSVVKLSRPIGSSSSSRPSIPPSKAAQMQSIRLDLGGGDIENYNKSLFLEHFNLKNVGSTVPDADLPSEYHCTVYECVFSTLHKGGLNTHIRYHTAQIAANSQAYRSCQKCCKIGIPLEVFGAHQCDDVMKSNHGNENSSAVENVTSSAKAVTSPTVTEKEKVSSSTTPVKISTTKLSLSLKRKSISSSVVKLSRPIGSSSSSRPSIPPSKAAQMQSIRLDLGGGKVKYKCKHCDFIAETNQSIAGHMNTHRAKKPKLQ